MRNKPSKFKPLKLAAILAALALLAASGIFFLRGFVKINGSFVRTSVETLDLSGSGITDYSPLERCTDLEFLDIRGNSIDAGQVSRLQRLLPNCEILWSMPLGNFTFDSNAESIRLEAADGLSASQLDMLRYDTRLASFDASGFDMPDECAVVLSQLKDEMPDCGFSWDIMIGGVLFPCGTVELEIPAETTPEEYSRLLLLPLLTEVDASKVGYSSELQAVTELLAQRSAVWSVELAGVSVKSDETNIDISGNVIDDFDDFSARLSLLPNLTKVEMCGCGQTNDQMDKLMAEHPDIKFVWTISFVRWKDVRTDITCFSSLNGSTQLYDETALEPLFKYCTDLVALDLGHSSIKDISMISNLTKLQALILGDNDIKDISPLAALQELEYLEIWKNDFTDISVLTQLPNLKDLNMTYCSKVKDFEPLMDLQCIEMLWIQNCGFPESLPERLEERYPDCTFSFYKYNSAHGNGWCWPDRYLGIRKAFRNWNYVIEYVSWDNVTYVEGVDLLPAIRKWD